jgi:hypothetical protein
MSTFSPTYPTKVVTIAMLGKKKMSERNLKTPTTIPKETTTMAKGKVSLPAKMMAKGPQKGKTTTSDGGKTTFAGRRPPKSGRGC